ncbi:hypothetical protein C4K00_0020 [Pseudomonas synxantha]|nr:hypothetical protein C4K00_0020 [Pseudomonas synxantha]
MIGNAPITCLLCLSTCADNHGSNDQRYSYGHSGHSQLRL